MTTPLDLSMDSLAEIAAEAGKEADAEARAAGIKPAGLLKRLRVRLVTAKARLGKPFGRASWAALRTSRRRQSGTNDRARHRLGA